MKQTMWRVLNLIILVGVLLFSEACIKVTQLERALLMAGENRGELETVLEHFCTIDNDSLKYQAACFLIENMPGRYSSYSPQLDSLKRRLHATFLLNEDLLETEAEEWKRMHQSNVEKIYDLDVITSDFLIKTIDISFKIWDDCPWKENISFNDFKEFILPYRIGNEPLEEWKLPYREKYKPVLDSLYQGKNIVEAGTVITSYLKEEGFKRMSRNKISHPNLGGLFLLDYRRGDCDVACDISIYTLRSLGMPCAMDQYVTSPFHRGNHYWNVLINSERQSVPFLYINAPLDPEKFDNRKKGKVYRNCFSIQPSKIKKTDLGSDLSILFKHPYLKDVSGEYFSNTLKINIEKKVKNKYVFLGVFSPSGWVAIDVGENKKGVAVFHNVEEKLIYQPLVLNEGSLQPACYPFVWQDNEAYYLIPDTTRMMRARMTRKYPIMDHLKKYLSTAVGVEVIGYNTLRLDNPTLLYNVVDTPAITPDVTPLRCEPIIRKPFRYIEYAAPYKKKIELAEIHFFNSNNKELIVEEVLEKKQMKAENQNETNKALDYDPLSYYISTFTSESLIFDMGEEVTIEYMTILPRNDDNFVRPGDEYELFYNSGTEGWKSIGHKNVTKEFLIYDDVPSNALLWLKNHSRGKEEQVFFMHEGEQVFALDL